MRAILGICCLAVMLGGCMGMMYTPQTVAEWQTMAKTLDGSGCFYLRGNSRPYADVSIVYVGVWGKSAPKYVDCLEALTPDTRQRLFSSP